MLPRHSLSSTRIQVPGDTHPFSQRRAAVRTKFSMTYGLFVSLVALAASSTIVPTAHSQMRSVVISTQNAPSECVSYSYDERGGLFRPYFESNCAQQRRVVYCAVNYFSDGWKFDSCERSRETTVNSFGYIVDGKRLKFSGEISLAPGERKFLTWIPDDFIYRKKNEQLTTCSDLYDWSYACTVKKEEASEKFVLRPERSTVYYRSTNMWHIKYYLILPSWTFSEEWIWPIFRITDHDGLKPISAEWKRKGLSPSADVGARWTQWK